MASFNKSLRRYLWVTFTSGMMLTKSYGQTFNYPSFNLPAVTPIVQFFDLGTLPTQPPAATTYTNFSVTVDWTAVSGDPWSNEARMRIVDSASQTTTYLTSSQATTGSASSGNATTMTWSGILSTSYNNGNALSIGALQTYGGSTATWSNVTVSLSNAAPATPPHRSMQAWAV